jgi:hypothetical protein
MRPAPSRLSRTARLVALMSAVVALALPLLAQAHGSSDATAVRPQFNSDTLRLVGVGAYVTERPHRALRIKVCLRKKYGRRFFKVRCNTRTGDGRAISARVGVPGCVDGVWRTTAAGQALGRKGWRHAAVDRSARVRC